MNRPRVMVLDEELPHPPNTGKRIRTQNLLRRLTKLFTIDLVVHDSDDSRFLRELEDADISVTIAPGRARTRSGPRFAVDLASSLLLRSPYSVYRHRTRAYARTVRGLIAKRPPGLIHGEWTPYAQYWRKSDPPLVVAAHNVESEVLSRIAHTRGNVAHRAFFQLQAKWMGEFERNAFSKASHATAVSARDAHRIRAWGCHDVELVPNGVDTSYFSPRDNPVFPRSLVFTGSMDWRPNQDAIDWFARVVHPHLIRKGPYRLTVVGRNPPQRFQEHAHLPEEIVLAGTVEDIRPFLASSSVVVVPLRIGGGSRLKILEALSMEKPVVSTTIGAEGLDLEPDRELLIADEGAAFADAIERLFISIDLRHQLASHGRSRVLASYDWDSIFLRQAALWERALR